MSYPSKQSFNVAPRHGQKRASWFFIGKRQVAESTIEKDKRERKGKKHVKGVGDD